MKCKTLFFSNLHQYDNVDLCARLRVLFASQLKGSPILSC